MKAVCSPTVPVILGKKHHIALVGQIVKEFAKDAHIAEVGPGLAGKGIRVTGKLRRRGEDALKEIAGVGLAGPLGVFDDDLELALQITQLVLGQQYGHGDGADLFSGVEGVEIGVRDP